MKKILLVAMGIVAFIFGGCCLTCCDDDTKETVHELTGTWKGNAAIASIIATSQHPSESGIFYSDPGYGESGRTITFGKINSYAYEEKFTNSTGTEIYKKSTRSGTFSTDTTSSIKKLLLSYIQTTTKYTDNIPTGVTYDTVTAGCLYYKLENSTSLYIVDTSEFNSTWSYATKYIKQAE